MYYQTENGTTEETPPINKKKRQHMGEHWVRMEGGSGDGSDGKCAGRGGGPDRMAGIHKMIYPHPQRFGEGAQ